MLRFCLSACLGLLLTACSTVPAPTDVKAPAVPAAVQPVPELALPRVAPAELGGDLELNQHLSISRGTDEHEIDVALAVNGSHLKLAAIGLGLRLITLDYDGSTVTEQRHPLLPGVVNGERILRDLVLTFWPVPALQARLPDGWTLREEADLRTLAWQGQPMIRIHYEGSSPNRRWQGKARFENLQRNYRIVILSTTS